MSRQVNSPKSAAAAAAERDDFDNPEISDPASATAPSKRPRPSRAAFVGGILLLGLTAALLPIAIGSIFVELVLPSEAEIYFFTDAPPRSPPGATAPRATVNYLNIAIVSLDEAKDLATLRVSGNRTCAASCPNVQLALFSLSGALARRVGLPPSATIVLPPDAQQISTTVDLPVGGQPSRYPFDTYDLVLAVNLQVIEPDGTITPLRFETQSIQSYLSLQSQLQRLNMSPPRSIDPRTVSLEAGHDGFQYVRALQFWRPLYLPVLAVLLVLLIAGAAAYSVYTQPINQLLLGVGSLVLGVWGIRSILVPGFPPYVTAVDLGLSLVILLLLGGIIARGVLHARRTRHESQAE